MCSHDRQHIFSLNISLSPNFLGNLSHRIYLCPLLSIGQFITNLARGETALRTETEPIEGDISAASRMRAMTVALSSNTGDLEVTGPSTTFLPSATYFNGSKPPERSSSYSG